MTNPESHYPFVHWPAANSVSNLTGIFNKTQDDCQIFNPPTTQNLLTYFQQKDLAATPYLMYVVVVYILCYSLHDEYRI